jgi:hypothetical protein
MLAGVRPAEISFDELDRRIGECCAWAAADKITGLLAPDTDDCDAFDRVHCEVTRLVFAAIADYASHEAKHGLVCRDALRAEQSRRTIPQERAQSDIPF